MISRSEPSSRNRFDWVFIGVVVALVLFGSIAVLSAANPLPYYRQILGRHLSALAIGVVLFAFGMSFNYQIFQDQAKAIYGAALALLVAVLAIGSVHKGHRAWIHLGFLTFQPSELVRIFAILVLAAFLSQRDLKVGNFSTVLGAMGLVVPLMLLILGEPDFATTLTFVPILIGMLFCAGAELTQLAVLGGYGAVTLAVPLLVTWCEVRYPNAAPGSWPDVVARSSHLGFQAYALMGGATILGAASWRVCEAMRWRVRAATFILIPLIFIAGWTSGIAVNARLKSYQRSRFATYMAPNEDIEGAAYHVHQSEIAIGSGGFFGKGIFSGTQSQLGFLPERHTDFIYAVVGEEMGFWGSMTLLVLYLTLLWRIVVAARVAHDVYGYLVCCGMATMLAFELILNVGMCVGLMPVAGLPLPLISYGGSSLAITLWSLGVVSNIYARRYTFLASS